MAREHSQDEIDAMFGVDDECPECGGDRTVYDCLDEIGCVDPESGCNLCARRCDFCK